MDSLMMNSMRASPTPSFGRKLVLNASSGLPRLIMICVAGRRSCSRLVRWTSNGTSSAIDLADVAFRARYRDRVSGLERGRCIVGADDRGDAQLARHDGGVTGAAAAIGDHRAGGLHHRLPVGRGRIGDQHLARAELGQMSEIGDDAHGARSRFSRRPICRRPGPRPPPFSV